LQKQIASGTHVAHFGRGLAPDYGNAETFDVAPSLPIAIVPCVAEYRPCGQE
jgi:hypothetical protein